MKTIKSSHFNKVAKQQRIEAKIKKYKDSIKDLKIKNLINDMPQNQSTLDVIEDALKEYIDNAEVPGSTDKEKWSNLVDGLKVAEQFLDESDL